MEQIKWHFCDKEQPKKTGSYLVSSKRNPGRVFQSRFYAPQTWSNGHRLEGGEVSHHKLRHSFAIELLRQGTNPRTVQELMRHSSIDTLFDHYAHVLRSDLAEAVERI